MRVSFWKSRLVRVKRPHMAIRITLGTGNWGLEARGWRLEEPPNPASVSCARSSSGGGVEGFPDVTGEEVEVAHVAEDVAVLDVEAQEDLLDDPAAVLMPPRGR